MSMCPICNSEGYCGLNIFECSNPTCSNFSISLYTQLNRAIKEEKEIDDDTYDYGDDNNRDYDYNPNDPPIELPLGFAPQWFQLGKSHRAEKPAVELPEDCSEGTQIVIKMLYYFV